MGPLMGTPSSGSNFLTSSVISDISCHEDHRSTGQQYHRYNAPHDLVPQDDMKLIFKLAW